ncbi:MAG: hypothetical protein JNL05_13090 [Flavobacteriales bacterium]|nr:hypothetical protein [Flavobacteriales bacterium]
MGNILMEGEDITGMELVLSFDNSGEIGRMAWSPDGRLIAVPLTTSSINLHNIHLNKLERSLGPNNGAVYCVAFNFDGSLLVSADEKSVRIWETTSGLMKSEIRAHEGGQVCVLFHPSKNIAVSGGADSSVKIWDAETAKLIRVLPGDQSRVTNLAFNLTGEVLACSYANGEVKVWKSDTGELIRTIKAERSICFSIAFSPTGLLATCGGERVIRIWNSKYELKTTLEGHTAQVGSLRFTADGEYLLSAGEDRTTRLWNCASWQPILVIRRSSSDKFIVNSLFNPKNHNIIATVGHSRKTNFISSVKIWKINYSHLGAQASQAVARYVNAKVVLVGDTGVGKSGLSLVLNNNAFQATDSTPGRKVWLFDHQEVFVENSLSQTRETLLWDLAGQPGYRIIHQLHLNEIAVALVVFDARSETDPLAGVRHWERALRLAKQRQVESPVVVKRFLVSARNDRGGVSIGDNRVQAVMDEFGFDGYYKTSAKEGWGIAELGEAIKGAIPWDELPEVVSTKLFSAIKEYLLELKRSGQLLSQTSDLFDEFKSSHFDLAGETWDLKNQFDTCIGRLENRDLIRRLSFGGYLLLQPELLDSYASALVNAAKEEPDGLGSMAEDFALTGKFYVPEEHRVQDKNQEQLLLHATVEELVRHDLALRESADDGRYLVFPSQFNRDYEDAPEPKGKAVAITFDGPVQSLYSTLTVRLGHSGIFSIGRSEMWRNAAVFTAKPGGKCGIFMYEFAEARGRIIIFYDEYVSAETKFHFEEYVAAHVRRKSIDGKCDLVRFFICPKCATPVPDAYVQMLRSKGQKIFNCFCPEQGEVQIADPLEQLRFPSKLGVMDQAANRERDFETFMVSAEGETRTSNFSNWAGGDRVTLAVVFTDVVGSTELNELVRDEKMNEIRRAHFVQSRRLIKKHNGREIKTIGDSFLIAFKNVENALNYSIEIHRKTGHGRVSVRAGIHIGAMKIEEGDIFGGAVNYAARVVGAIRDDEIWISNHAKEDLDALGSPQFDKIVWERITGIKMKGFAEAQDLWKLNWSTSIYGS